MDQETSDAKAQIVNLMVENARLQKAIEDAIAELESFTSLKINALTILHVALGETKRAQTLKGSE